MYVDVAIRRWQAFTKSDAILAATGETFDEVAAAGGGMADAVNLRRSEARNEQRAKDVAQADPLPTSLRERTILGSRLGQPPREHQFKPRPERQPQRPSQGARRANPRSSCARSWSARSRPDRTTAAGEFAILEGILLRIAEDALRGDTKSAAIRPQPLRRPRCRANCRLRTSAKTTREVLEAFAERAARSRTTEVRT